MHHRKPHRLVLTAVALIATAVFASSAIAALTSEAGGQQIRVDKRTDNVASRAAGTTWVKLNGSFVRISLNASRLIDASFTAESRCFGVAGTTCAVRIVAVNLANNIVTELNPVAGLNFAFDSVPQAQDLLEGHAMDRSKRLQAGNYEVRVELATTSAGTTLEVDDWHFAVYQNA